MTEDEARRRLSQARVARLATADRTGRPHLVPIVFAVAGNELVTAVDHKPKRSTRLRRLANLAENPQAAVLADGYSEDWSELWWVRADGLARELDPGTTEAALALDRLVARYPQYHARRPAGPVVLIEIERWVGWTGSAEPTPTVG